MKKEWRTIDKSACGPGPWQDEPDKAHWIDSATGLDCLLVRHELMGHLCGYVGVPKGHPLFGVDDTGADSLLDINVHGGITFANKCTEGVDEAHGICHVSPHKVWWFGFDCAHAGGKSPGHADLGLQKLLGGEYRDVAYVKRQCALLAKQLSKVRVAEVKTIEIKVEW